MNDLEQTNELHFTVATKKYGAPKHTVTPTHHFHIVTDYHRDVKAMKMVERSTGEATWYTEKEFNEQEKEAVKEFGRLRRQESNQARQRREKERRKRESSDPAKFSAEQGRAVDNSGHHRDESGELVNASARKLEQKYDQAVAASDKGGTVAWDDRITCADVLAYLNNHTHTTVVAYVRINEHMNRRVEITTDQASEIFQGSDGGLPTDRTVEVMYFDADKNRIELGA